MTGNSTGGGIGVQGTSTSIGVSCTSSSFSDPGVFGYNNASGAGVQGSSFAGVGGYFTSTSYVAAFGSSGTGIGVKGQSSATSYPGVFGNNLSSGPGVLFPIALAHLDNRL